ncbi:hypothetical protein MXB_4218, partial [Myxobolus squamalis]
MNFPNYLTKLIEFPIKKTTAHVRSNFDIHTMRLKRHKNFKRNIKFFESNYGFYKPHRLFVDATFAQAALIAKVDLKDQISKYFGDEVIMVFHKIVVSKCVINEAQNLGPQLSGASQILSQFKPWPCSHNFPVPASQCIEEIIGIDNPHRLFLASQDQTLKRNLSVKSNYFFL